MSLNAAVEAEMPFLRQQAESMMLDTFTAYAPAAPTKDMDGMEVPGYELLGTTRGKIQGRGGAGQSDTVARTESVGGVDRPVITGGLHLPVDSPTPVGGARGIGWEYVLTSAGPSTPPDLYGSRWLVVDSPAKSYMTARRLDVVRLP